MGTSPIITPNRDLQTLFSVGAVRGLSDGQLLGRFVACREEAAFEALIQRHGPMVLAVCRRILRDHHDAEDAFQATFLVLARKAPSIAHRELVANWLYAVAHKSATRVRAMISKRRAREKQVTEMPEPKTGSERMKDDLLSQLDRELIRLPAKYRTPIVLCELEGKTHREAAEQLGWPIGTVSGRLSRARAMLASRLSRPGLTLSVGSFAVLLARDAASANMPTKLIVSTAQAASLSAAGRAVMAGMASAEVAALVEGVLKTMLLSKIKSVTAVLLMGFTLAGSGMGLSYRTRAAEGPNQSEEIRHLGPTLQKAVFRDERAAPNFDGWEEVKNSASENPGGQVNGPGELDLHGEALDTKNVVLVQTEGAIAAGVMEAEEAAKGKTPQQIQKMIEELTAAWRQKRLAIRATEATIRRLDKIREADPGLSRNDSIRRLPKEKKGAIAADVMEVEEPAKGKNLQQITKEMRNGLRADWWQKQLEIRATEATVRRLVMIQAGKPTPYRKNGIGRSPKEKEKAHVQEGQPEK